MSDIFKTLEYEAFRAGITPRTKQSMDWFRRKAHYINQIDRRGLMNEDPIELKNRPVINLPGNMYMFFYDPKHKDTLPYYDTFPLCSYRKSPGWILRPQPTLSSAFAKSKDAGFSYGFYHK